MIKLFIKILLLTLCFSRACNASKDLLSGFGEITDRKTKKTTTEKPSSSESEESYEYLSSSSEESSDSSEQSSEYEEVTSSGELEETHRDQNQSFVLPEEYVFATSDKPNCFLANSKVEEGYMNGLGGCCRRHPFNDNYRENMCSCPEYFYEDENLLCQPVTSVANTISKLYFVVYVIVYYVIQLI